MTKLTPTGRLSKQQYKALADACIAALIEGRYDISIDVILPKAAKLPKDMPRGMPIDMYLEDGELPPVAVPEGYTHRVIGAKKLLKWLHKRKHSALGWDDVCRYKISLIRIVNSMERGLLAGLGEEYVDNSQEIVYDADEYQHIENNEEE